MVSIPLILWFKSVVNLAELGGREGVLSQAYNKHVTEWNSPDVGYSTAFSLVVLGLIFSDSYCDYDFHAETKGMKWATPAVIILLGVYTRVLLGMRILASLSQNRNKLLNDKRKSIH